MGRNGVLKSVIQGSSKLWNGLRPNVQMGSNLGKSNTRANNTDFCKVFPIVKLKIPSLLKLS